MNFEGGDRCKVIRSIGVSLGLWPYRCTILGKTNGALAVTIIALFIVAQLQNDLIGTVKGVLNSGGYLQLTVFITHEFSMALFVKIMNGIVVPTVLVVKNFTFAWYMEEVKYMFEWIQSDYDSLANENELRLLEKSADLGTYICNIFLSLTPTVLIAFGYPLLPILFNVGGSFNQSRSVLIPITVEYFVDPDEYFYCIIFHIDATIVVGVSILIVTESVTVHFVAHACGLLELTGERVERVLENSILNVLRGKTYLSTHEQLVATIQLHQRALKLIEYLNATILPHYWILMVIGVISISMNFYFVTKALLLRKITGEMMIALAQLVIQFFYMGCANYIGQLILNKGDELFTKTYCASWHAASLPVQKMLWYMRERSMQPTGFKFGGLFTSSMELFSKQVNTSMSYFMVLYSMA